VSFQVSSQLQGADEAIAVLAKIVPRVVSQDAQRLFLAIGRDIERAIERRQPSRDTGQLKRATVTRGVSQTQLYKRGPAAFVLVRTRKSDPNAAPHAYPIESGSKEKKPTNKKVMVFRTKEGKLVFARRIAKVPARPFFEPGVQDAAPAALSEAAAGMEQLLLRIGK
jgi:hypothetical protein